ncbi:ABC transporter substrate-binding protein [Pseudoclavibacter sp. RFBJ3]|uniref:ABC transporter substrate-binding protein n=1 Tax=unclassified Pseudoclavibacter TaxID=2615177 RepID=UPI000CE78482|nr:MULTISPECIES: ABC transporter substrate-binding protein [unclassified Pseudoclavibacter]PPF86556.1 ABC transporter substrate-binding protein [Pseudoclavibacter sp. RFBJ5]PPF95289.1 ABC transporter substrate-binding protein [Pseudoclavibacter sp. RFBJ3]PPF97723.1 ABC transporter substrate-binding protein [Pseudoclavibacter sp. RFBH5]PPG22624.1 ABC transporter substrate-binding protein [Pseudoclavibacter sp. RFBI4]
MNKRLSIVATLALAGLALTACSQSPATGETGDTAAAATATSLDDFGSMEALVEAAKAEGTINVIALPDDWANYGEIKAGFTEKYGITVNSILPDASSQEEIAAADANKGTDQAPDVFDLGANVALASTDYFAPYQVENWEHIPDANKEATGLWVNDYTGIMSVGYNATKYGEITSIDQLTDAKFANSVALNGKPAEAGAAFNGFLSANNAVGGDFADLQPGLDYFAKLKEAGTLNLKDVTAGTVDAGEHGVVFDWSYNQLSTVERLEAKGVEWATFVPKGGEIAAYYNQAINVDAPNPAAARLWMEYLYSPEVQNIWLAGGAMPVLFDWMEAEGTVDQTALESLPEVEGTPVTPTSEEAETANAFLAENWDSTIS